MIYVWFSVLSSMVAKWLGFIFDLVIKLHIWISIDLVI